MMFEMANSRKFGTRSELKLSLQRGLVVITGIGSVGGYADEVPADVTKVLNVADGCCYSKLRAPVAFPE
jgi:hypothetical protein